MDAAEIEKELETLEAKAEHLRALYEQYFMGVDRIEPLVHRRDVERRIITLRREQIRNTAQRFKFNTLVARFNTMSQHWARVVREIENGTYRRDVLKAAARFGEGALAALGAKKTKELAAAVSKAQTRRPVDDAYELGEDDLVEDEASEVEDEAPTPPKPTAAPVAAFELSQGDLPVIGPAKPAEPPKAQPATLLGRAFRGPAPAPQPAAASPAAGPQPSPAAPQRTAGLRWGGGADPAKAPAPAAGDVKKRVAELAAELGAQRPTQPTQGGAAGGPAQPRGGFGELDLDFDESLAAPAASSPRAIPAARPLAASARAPEAPARSAPAPKPAVMGFGELDMALDDPLPPAPAAPAPSPVTAPSAPVPAARPGVQQRAMAPIAGARAAVTGGPPRPAVPAPAPQPRAEGELGDQRIRQIYAQYVEAKRSTQESTAGVTFEKLAQSLRAQATKLKSAHPNRAIDYEVVVKDGKTHLKPVLR